MAAGRQVSPGAFRDGGQRRRQLADKRLALTVAPDALALLAAEGYDPAFGARPLKRVIQRRLQNAIALELLEGRYTEGDTIAVTREGDGLRFTRGS